MHRLHDVNISIAFTFVSINTVFLFFRSLHGHDRQVCDVDIVWDFALSLFMKPTGKFLDTVGGFVDQSFAKYGIIKGTIIALIVICAMSYWMRDFFKSFVGFLFSSRPASQPREPQRSIEREATPAPQPTSVINNFYLDPKSLGDCVQNVMRDDKSSRPQAIGMKEASPSASPEKVPIENVADGYDIINKSDVAPDSSEGEKTPPKVLNLDDKEEPQKD